MITHHKCIQQQWIPYQLYGVLKNEINKSDTSWRKKKRNNIRLSCPCRHVEKLWFVLSFPPHIIYIPVCVCSTYLTFLKTYQKNRNFLIIIVLLSYPLSLFILPLIFYSDISSLLCFSPSTHKKTQIILYSYWVCCDFYAPTRTCVREQKKSGMRFCLFRMGELSVIIMQYYILLSFCWFCYLSFGFAFVFSFFSLFVHTIFWLNYSVFFFLSVYSCLVYCLRTSLKQKTPSISYHLSRWTPPYVRMRASDLQPFVICFVKGYRCQYLLFWTRFLYVFRVYT